jgi:beta-glucosidase
MKGRTYRYFEGEPLWAFGYGLSYTTFGYDKLAVPATARAGQDVTVKVDVKNTGKQAGEEVVQVYVKGPSVPGAPIKSLAAFQRVALKQGEHKMVNLKIPARLVNAAGAYTVTAGTASAALEME